jgi:hypothetical protein
MQLFLGLLNLILHVPLHLINESQVAVCNVLIHILRVNDLQEALAALCDGGMPGRAGEDLQECADFTGIPGQGAGDREMILIVPVVVWLVLPHQQSNVRRTVCTDIAQIYGGPLHINIAYRHGNQVGNRSVEVVAPIDGFSFCHAKIHALIELNVNHPFHLRFL